MARIGMFTGSFDPLTKGHLDLIVRASQLFDHLYVGVFYNKNKEGLFDLSVRQGILEASLSDLANVSVVVAKESLTVDLARELGVTHLIRGLRNATDLEYEANMDYFNKRLAPEIETLYLIAQQELQPISSSRVRELIHFEADISAYVPPAVLKEVEARRGK